MGITPNIQLYGDEMIVKYGAKTYSTQNWENWEEMIQIVLGNDKYGVCNNYQLGGGRELSYLDMADENNVCVLGGGLKQMLFDYTDPVGETITLNGMPFLVVGWYQQKDISYYPEVDNILLLPYTLNRSLNQNQPITSWTVKAPRRPPPRSSPSWTAFSTACSPWTRWGCARGAASGCTATTAGRSRCRRPT